MSLPKNSTDHRLDLLSRTPPSDRTRSFQKRSWSILWKHFSVFKTNFSSRKRANSKFLGKKLINNWASDQKSIIRSVQQSNHDHWCNVIHSCSIKKEHAWQSQLKEKTSCLLPRSCCSCEIKQIQVRVRRETREDRSFFWEENLLSREKCSFFRKRDSLCWRTC